MSEWRAGAWSRLSLVVVLWALCYPLVGTGLDAAPPLTFAALRALVGGTALGLVAVALRRPFPRGRTMGWAALGGALATGLGFAGM